MEQREYWKSRWEKVERKPANNFARRIFSLIKNKKFKTLLDLGCGNGSDSIYFANKGFKVTAIDFSESGIKQLQKEIRQKRIKKIIPICQDVKKINFIDSYFDIIYAHLSLHYFDDKTTTQVFNKLHRILKKKGLIFIKCKSIEDKLYGNGKKIENNMYILNNHVRHFFDKDYMREKLGKFKILKLRKTSCIYSYKSSFIEAVATK